MKKVIFIGGTSHSGSTILDLLLSNHPNVLSLGEIHALINPTRLHHFEKRKVMNEKDKSWAAIINEGKKNFYKNLIANYPDKQFFIDSSKDQTWITYQQKQLKKLKNVKYKNVLIYKTPLEFAFSLWKRGVEKNWPRAWKHYYRYYFSKIKESLVVTYKDVCLNTIAHNKLKEFTSINFDTEKIITVQENFFGSTNQQNIGDKTGFLRYSEIKDDQLQQRVNAVLENDQKITEILKFLNKNKNSLITKDLIKINNLQYPSWLKIIITQKKLLQQKYRKIFPDYAWEKKQIKNNKLQH